MLKEGTFTVRTAHGLDDQVRDVLVGLGSDDTINGFGGPDILLGMGGHDVINGGFGDDFINGGAGWDTLTGGAGRDNFFFSKHESGSHFATADVITDFNDNEDRISLGSYTGKSSEYMETMVRDSGNHEQNFDLARSFAAHHIGEDGIRVVFASDHHDGYLFADIDGNGVMDTGIELKGLNDLTDFSWRQLGLPFG